MSNGADIFTLAARFRARLLAGENRAALQLVNAYGRAYQRLQGDIEALIAAMGELPDPTWGQVEQLGLYRNLQAQIRSEINRYAVFAEGTIANEAQTSIGLGLNDSSALVLANFPGAARAIVQGSLSVLVPEQVYTMLGFLQKQSPLYVNLSRLGEDVAATVAEKLRQGIILGMNPRAVAGRIRAATGMGLTWSLRTARTANLNAYREATHANFLANSHVVKEWTWTAALGDGRACMSCISKHGRRFPLTVRLNDHHNGRCLLPGQLVETTRGQVKVEDVRVGDMVRTHTGKYRSVLATTNRPYDGEVITMMQDGGKVTVTPEHKVLTQRGWVEARDVIASDTLRTLNAIELRDSKRSTVQPSAVKKASRFPSRGRLRLDLCHSGSVSTASMASGNAKSMLYVPTANWGMGNKEASLRACKNSSSCGEQNVCQLTCRQRARLRVASGVRAAASIGARKFGSSAISRRTAVRASIGSISQRFINFINERVLMPVSLVSSRYVAFSPMYLRLSHAQTGSPSFASKLASQRSELYAPISAGVFMRRPSIWARWWMERGVRSSLTAISAAVRLRDAIRKYSSSTSVQREPDIEPPFANGNIIHQMGNDVQRYSGLVYDLTVDVDHSFIAGGIVVHNCAALPVTLTFRELGLNVPEPNRAVETGEAWFARQSAATQKMYMGNAMWQAWRDEQFGFEDLSVPYQDDVYGELLREASLKDLLGEQARKYYARA